MRKPAIWRDDLQGVFTATVEEQLNYPLLRIGVVRRGHWSRQYYFAYLVRLVRFDLKVFTKVYVIGCGIDQEKGSCEQTASTATCRRG